MRALGLKFDLVGCYTRWSRACPGRSPSPGAPARRKTPVDLTGCSARLVVVDLLEAAEPPSLRPEFSTTGGHIALGGAAGTVAIDLDEDDTARTSERASYRFYLTDCPGQGDACCCAAGSA
jgi:hypothetical protein